MKPKNKSFIEDIFVLFIIGVLIYGIYSIFFSSEDIEIKENIENKTVVEKTIENQKESLIEENKTEEEVQKDMIVLEKQNEEIIAEQPKEVIEEPKTVEEVKSRIEKVGSKVEKFEQPSGLSEEQTKVEIFYQPIREKIYEDIKKNIDKTSIKNGEYVTIRLTVLKNGKSEQLTFMEGNKEYFELVKPSIYKAFPIQIDDSLKNSFPRYFRMKIEF